MYIDKHMCIFRENTFSLMTGYLFWNRTLLNNTFCYLIIIIIILTHYFEYFNILESGIKLL